MFCPLVVLGIDCPLYCPSVLALFVVAPPLRRMRSKTAPGRISGLGEDGRESGYHDGSGNGEEKIASGTTDATSSGAAGGGEGGDVKGLNPGKGGASNAYHRMSDNE